MKKFGRSLTFARIALETAAIKMISRQAGHRHIVGRLLELPGVPSKIGQVIAMKTGVQVTGSSKAVLPMEQVLRTIEVECPALWEDLDELDPTPIVASLSQVHRGRLQNGKSVALKVQFPELRSEIEEQVDTALSAFGKYGARGATAEEVVQFAEYFRESLTLELDYRREAEAQVLFSFFFGLDPNFIIPRAYPEYSTATLLVQDFVESVQISKSTLSRAHQREACERLIRFQLRCIFEMGCAHGDLHPGNWGYIPDQRAIALYDFGSVIRLSASQIEALKQLICLPPTADEGAHVAAYQAIGFDPEKLARLSEVLPALTTLLFEPLRTPGPWRAEDWHLGNRLEVLLGERKWLFRLAGPPWFFGLLRSCQGVIHALSRSDLPLDIAAIYREIVGEQAAPAVGTSVVVSRSTMLSTLLKVEISDTKTHEQCVYLEFPAGCAARLEELMPVNALKAVEAAGGSIAQLTKQAVSTSYAPQDLFCGSILDRTYRIWLE